MDTDIVELDRIAVEESLRIVRSATGDQWDLPTPCTGWTLRDLVSHMTGQHLGFAAAATDGGPDGADLAVWRPRPLGDRPHDAYEASCGQVLAAFAAAGVPRRTFPLPEIHPTFAFPPTTAIGFHFLDYVVHSWDAAAALGVAVDLPAGALQAALDVARLIPDDERRRTPDAQIGPPLPVPADAPLLDRLLALVGRDPQWSPQAANQATGAAASLTQHRA
ncbi:TIGR03086 family metal-binding protein [Streptacidiphilus griseoplanus]|uniref:TIGR03086 family metal-binding protein n=1 Tax=Peterkaempfera griseoplana TaxID=66896 RepID=UPI0006E3BE7C|nr:TIGR03086 family metal-binding protein [Peterkaempfera griseoplana]